MEIKTIKISDYNKSDQLIILNMVGMYMVENRYTTTYYKTNEGIYKLQIIKYECVELLLEYSEQDRIFNIYNINFKDKELLNDIEDIIDREFDFDSWD